MNARGSLTQNGWNNATLVLHYTTLLRRTMIIGTHDVHKKSYTFLFFFLTMLGPDYCVPLNTKHN